MQGRPVRFCTSSVKLERPVRIIFGARACVITGCLRCVAPAAAKRGKDDDDDGLHTRRDFLYTFSRAVHEPFLASSNASRGGGMVDGKARRARDRRAWK